MYSQVDQQWYTCFVSLNYFRNVHNDIHGGINNWIEHRCPLSVYGCPYTWRRMQPHDSKHNLVFNKTSESFAVVSNPKPKTVKNKAKPGASKLKTKSAQSIKSSLKKTQPSHSYLVNLPVEILLKVLENLDSLR